MSQLRWNPDCPTCRKMSPVQIEQTRRGGEWRVLVEGQTLAHARSEKDAKRLMQLIHEGYKRRG